MTEILQDQIGKRIRSFEQNPNVLDFLSIVMEDGVVISIYGFQKLVVDDDQGWKKILAKASGIKTITKFKNQMVAVFDENGQQMPQFQGWVGDVAAKLKPFLTEKQFEQFKHSVSTEIRVEKA
mgnify:FL=1